MKKPRVFTGMGLVYTINFMTFILLSLAPSCPQSKAPEYYFEQGKIESSKTNYYVAIKLFTKAIKMQPHYLEAYAEKAKAEIKVDSVINAIRDYDSILVMKNLNVQQMGEYTYMKAKAHYLWYGLDTTFCRLAIQGCDQYGYGKCCDLRRNFCK